MKNAVPCQCGKTQVRHTGEDTIIEYDMRHTLDDCYAHGRDIINVPIYRKDAIEMLEWRMLTNEALVNRIHHAIRSELEAQHEYDNSPELQALLRQAALEEQ